MGSKSIWNKFVIPDEDGEALALLTWLDGWTPEKFNPKDVVFENPARRFLDSFKEGC